MPIRLDVGGVSVPAALIRFTCQQEMADDRKMSTYEFRINHSDSEAVLSPLMRTDKAGGLQYYRVHDLVLVIDEKGGLADG